MSLGYVCERSSRSISLLCTHPGSIHERLAPAWVEGMSQIHVSEIPEHWTSARAMLTKLQTEFNRKESERWGNAHASIQGRHASTLVKLAEMMLSLDAMFETMFEEAQQNAKSRSIPETRALQG